MSEKLVLGNGNLSEICSMVGCTVIQLTQMTLTACTDTHTVCPESGPKFLNVSLSNLQLFKECDTI